MPHVNLPGSVQLYYEQFPSAPSASLASLSLDSTSGSTSSAPKKPSLLLLAPSFLNSTFLAPYVDAFTGEYEVTTLEMRSNGRSRNSASPTYDYWVAAADVACAMEALRLPPSHVFGAGCLAFQAAMKLSLLVPSLVLSLTLVGAPTLFAPPRVLGAFQEIVEGWTRPADEEDWIEVMGGVGEFLLGEKKWDDAEQDWDRVVPTVVRRYHPYRARDIWMISAPNHRNPGLTPEVLGAIQHPMLVIQGDNDLCFDHAEVEDQLRHLTATKELEFHKVEGGPHMLAVTHPSAVLARMGPFLARHSPSSAPSYAPADFHSALASASHLASDPNIALRNPHHPESYSFLTSEEKEAAKQAIEEMKRVEETCELSLPMCSEREDWETPLEKDGEERRWT
ncbi:hypothetical protein JCM10213_002645 [Rhodosporidiobolus nylandii]